MLQFFLHLILFLLIVGRSVAQDVRVPVARFSHPVLDRIMAMVDSKRYQEAINLALVTADQFRLQSNWEGYISLMLRAAEIETFEVWKGRGFPEVNIYPDYRRPQKYLQSLNKYAEKIINDYPYLKANVLYTNAVVYEWLDMPDTAELLHNQALELRKNIYGESSREVADSYLWRGVLYSRGLQREDLAERDYRLAQELEKKFMPDSRYALGSVYYRLAYIAIKHFRFDEALTLAHQYFSLYNDLPYEQAFGLQIIANVYWHKDDFEKSLEYRREAIKIYKKSDFQEDLIVEYINLSSDLASLLRYDEAEQALKDGERILNVSDVQDPLYKKQLLFENYGELYRIMKRYDAAKFYFNQALQIALKQYGERNDEVADIYQKRGQVLMEQNLFEKALEDHQKVLMVLIPEFHATSYHTIPEVQYEHPYFKNIISANFNKGDTFFTWFKSSGNMDHLEQAVENYRSAYRQLITARESIGDELSKPFLMADFFQSVENSIACANVLYAKTNNPTYRHDIFYFIELTKYLNVLDALQRAARSSNSSVPADILFELKNTKQELNELQRIELQREHLALSIDSVTILRDKILTLIGKRRELMSRISQYSDHTEANDNNILSMENVQELLKNDEQIMEFFWGTDSIYCLSLTKESAEVTVTERDSEIDSIILSIRNLLDGQRSFNANQVENYSLMTSRIYHRLFEPLINNKRKIIVIPDEALNLIPIECLVTRHDSEKLTFKELAYLIYDHEITYAYSSSILFHKIRNQPTEIKSVLVFSYSDASETIVDNNNELSPLSGTYRELETISHNFKKVMRFTGHDAFKKNFISHSSDHDLIHLGVHGIGDTEVAENSRLIFRSDSLESGDLYAYDIYNLKIDARLVVLSGCETGLGKRQTGEGMFSIARAFSYAGCPSVVMSLWRAPDVFTAPVMEEFYKHIHEGRSIGFSLRASKLKFLEDSDEFLAHPSNWAGFVINGQDQSFNEKSTPLTTWLMLAVIGVVLTYSVLKWKRILN